MSRFLNLFFDVETFHLINPDQSRFEKPDFPSGFLHQPPFVKVDSSSILVQEISPRFRCLQISIERLGSTKEIFTYVKIFGPRKAILSPKENLCIIITIQTGSNDHIRIYISPNKTCYMGLTIVCH